MLKLVVREYDSKKEIDVVDFHVDVLLNTGGFIVMHNTGPIVYEHKKPAMRVQFGFKDAYGKFYPLPVTWAVSSDSPGKRSHCMVGENQILTISNVEFKADYSEFPKSEDSRVGWFRR
jgi:hypothetical protein